MKRIGISLLLFVCVLIKAPIVGAEDLNYLPNTQIGQEEQGIEEFGEEIKQEAKEELEGALSEEVKEKMEEHNLNTLDQENFLGFKIGDFFSLIFDYCKAYFKTPLLLFANIVLIILLTALLNGFQGEFLNEQLKRVLSYVSVVAVLAVLIKPLLGLFENLESVILTCNNFLVSFTPIFASIITLSGKGVSALTYSTLLFTFSQFVGFAIKAFIMPLLSIFLAFGVTGATSVSIQMKSITSGIKKCITTALGVLTTVFVAFLSLQTLVANAGDGVSVKAGKFIVGNFVPVIGGALSDAFASVYSYMGVIKSLVGSFGIVSMVLTFLPSLVQFALTYLFIYLAKMVSELLDINGISDLLDNVCTCLSIMLAVIICFAFLMIISVTIILVVGAVV